MNVCIVVIQLSGPYHGPFHRFRSSHFLTPSRHSFILSQSWRSKSSNPTKKSVVSGLDALLAIAAARFKYVYNIREINVTWYV